MLPVRCLNLNLKLSVPSGSQFQVHLVGGLTHQKLKRFGPMVGPVCQSIAPIRPAAISKRDISSLGRRSFFPHVLDLGTPHQDLKNTNNYGIVTMVLSHQT